MNNKIGMIHKGFRLYERILEYRKNSYIYIYIYIYICIANFTYIYVFQGISQV